MRYNLMRRVDISNGPGVRVSIFVQGCTFNCVGCFNQSTHDFNGGEEYTKETEEQLLALCDRTGISGLSILGGEPLHPKNIDTVTSLAKTFKERFPNKTLWLWTGYLFEDIYNKEVIRYIDVIIDGQFVEPLKNLRLPYCGSENQRVIDIKKTKETGNIILYSS